MSNSFFRSSSSGIMASNSGMIGDLAGSEEIQPSHIAEAIQYRSLDRRPQRDHAVPTHKLVASQKGGVSLKASTHAAF